MNKGTVLLFCASLLGQTIVQSHSEQTELPETLVKIMHAINEDLFKFHYIVYSKQASIDRDTGALKINCRATSEYQPEQTWFPLGLVDENFSKKELRLVPFLQIISGIE